MPVKVAQCLHVECIRLTLSSLNMPGVLKTLKFTPFEGATIGATVEGLDFSSPISKETSDELLDALHVHGVLVARATNVEDDTMIALGKAWGPLDNIKAHKKAGRKFRLESDEIFDVSK